MSLHTPDEAKAALDSLPVGARIVACAVDPMDGGAFGILFEAYTNGEGERRWRDRTTGTVPHATERIVAEYDDVVVAYLPEKGSS